MRRANSRDYFIIKLRVYASEYHLRRWHDHGIRESHRKHVESCARHQEFFEKLYEHVTGNSYHDLFFEYSFAMGDCAREILESEHGIIMNRGEAWQTYILPKERHDLIEWFIQNVGDIPHKVLKRSRVILDFHIRSTKTRDHFRLSPERQAELRDILNKKKV